MPSPLDSGQMMQLLRPLIVIALYALLLPVAGPLLDHHYVEWQHNHGHFYFGAGAEGDSGFHLHVYDSRGNHGHLPPDYVNEETGLPEGLAYFSNYDGFAQGLIYTPAGPALETPCYPDLCDLPLLAPFDRADSIPVGHHPAPPQKPPTA